VRRLTEAHVWEMTEVHVRGDDRGFCVRKLTEVPVRGDDRGSCEALQVQVKVQVQGCSCHPQIQNYCNDF
jgi:hypothetical protein